MAEQQLVIDDVEKRCETARSYIQETILSPFKDSFHHTLSAWIHDSQQSPSLVGDHPLFDCSVDTHRLYNAVDIVRRKCSAAISDFVEETVNKLNQPHQKQNEADNHLQETVSLLPVLSMSNMPSNKHKHGNSCFFLCFSLCF